MIQLYKDPEGKRIFRARGQTLAEASRKAPSSSISKKPVTSDSDNKPQKSIEESTDNEKAVHLQVDGDVTEVSDLSHRTSSVERSPAPEESRNNEVSTASTFSIEQIPLMHQNTMYLKQSGNLFILTVGN